jgi:polygalacturonase
MSNISDFGAKGDGRRDDTEAIVHALTEGDGTLIFPRGDYRITRTIVVELAKLRRIAIEGSGGTAKLLMEGAGPAFELRGTHTGSAAPDDFRPEQWASERMPTISQIEIEGRHAAADGVRIVGVMQATLTGVLLRKLRHGVHVVNRARNLLLSHCHIYHNTGCGVFLEGVNLHQANISGCHISYNRRGGIRIEGSEIRNLQITGNDIEYNNGRAFGEKEADAQPTAEIYIDCSTTGTVREGTISGNTLQATYSPGGANVRIIGDAKVGSHRAGMWTISGNLIGSQAVNIHLTAVQGVTIDGNYIYSGHHRNLLAEKSRNLVIGSNCFGHNPDYKDQELCTGIRLEDCDYCTLTGLQIQDAQAGKHTVKGVRPIERQGLIELVRSRRINLTGVQIFEGTPNALYLEDCRDTLITGCSILDTRAERLTQASVKWTGEGFGNRIALCRVNQPISAPPHVTQRDNILE